MRSQKFFLSVLVSVACLSPAAAPGLAGAAAASTPVLAFAGDTARIVAGQVAVPVECEGARNAFCSGTVTLSRAGRRVTIPFSVKGGAAEPLYVPLRLGATGRPAKVSAALSTLPPLGGPITTRTLLFVR